MRPNSTFILLSNNSGNNNDFIVIVIVRIILGNIVFRATIVRTLHIVCILWDNALESIENTKRKLWELFQALKNVPFGGFLCCHRIFLCLFDYRFYLWGYFLAIQILSKYNKYNVGLVAKKWSHTSRHVF